MDFAVLVVEFYFANVSHNKRNKRVNKHNDMNMNSEHLAVEENFHVWYM